MRAAAITNPQERRSSRPGPPAIPLGGFHLSWHISAGARWVPGTGPHTRGHRFGPKKSKSTVRDSQLLVRCIPLRSEQQCCCRPAVAGGHFSSVSRRAARQVLSAWSPRALERAGGQKQACGSCAQLPLRCERLQPAMRPPKLPYFLAAAPVLHLHGHSPENETGARLQVGSAVARLPLQRLSPAPSGCCMANVVAPDFATATTFICMVSSPDVAALNLFASALLDFDFVLLLLAAS